jgi:hypothetical protein
MFLCILYKYPELLIINEIYRGTHQNHSDGPPCIFSRDFFYNAQRRASWVDDWPAAPPHAELAEPTE